MKTPSNELLYGDADGLDSAGSFLADSAIAVPGGKRYFIGRKTLSDEYGLYEAIGVADRPLKDGPIMCEVQADSSASSLTPARLAGGRKYAGYVGVDSLDIKTLCILWPLGVPTYAPTGGRTVHVAQADPDEYHVTAVPARFDRFPDGRINTAAIVPLGDFLDEIIAYEGGYLHIARIRDDGLIMNSGGESVVPVVATLPWSELGESFAAGIFASAKCDGVRYVAPETGIKSFKDMQSGLAMKVLSP